MAATAKAVDLVCSFLGKRWKTTQEFSPLNGRDLANLVDEAYDEIISLVQLYVYEDQKKVVIDEKFRIPQLSLTLLISYINEKRDGK